MSEETKRAKLQRMLTEGWISSADLMAALGWNATTVRGAISSLAKKTGAKVERERVDGVTRYRIAAA